MCDGIGRKQRATLVRVTVKVVVLVGVGVAIGSALVGCGERALDGGANGRGGAGASGAAGRGAAGAGGRGGMSGSGGGAGSADYSCKAIPLTANDACPVANTPKAGLSCSAQACTVCNSLQGVAGGQYLDIYNELKDRLLPLRAARATRPGPARSAWAADFRADFQQLSLTGA